MARENYNPELILRLLGWFCPPGLYESIEGDLLEQFDVDVKTVGLKIAKRRLAWNVIKFFRPGIVLRNKFSIELNQMHMLQNYAKVMLRTLLKRKVHSAINIFGLTAGITFSMLIGVFVWQEMNVNHQLKDVDRLYILEREQDDTRAMNFFAPASLVKTMQEQYPTNVESYYRFFNLVVHVWVSRALRRREFST